MKLSRRGIYIFYIVIAFLLILTMVVSFIVPSR